MLNLNKNLLLLFVVVVVELSKQSVFVADFPKSLC